MKFFVHVFLFLFCPLAAAESTLIASAANFSKCFQLLKDQFEENTSHNVAASFGSSGALYAQIRNGAPYDAFLSADQHIPAKLTELNLTVPGSTFTYAIGRLQLWSNSFAIADQSLTQALTDDRLARLALAKPRVAPYGYAALQTLEALELYQELKPKLVFGENVSQGFQFVSSKNAQLGFAAAAQLSEISVEYRIDVPPDYHDLIKQDAAVLVRGASNPATQEFMKFLASDAGQSIIMHCGYTIPNTEP